jgi:hypothetical protein
VKGGSTPPPGSILLGMFENIIADYLVALEMLREAKWASEKEIGEAYVNETLEKVVQYKDFPVYYNSLLEDTSTTFDNWYLAIEKIREGVIKIYGRDSASYLSTYLRGHCPLIMYYKSENIRKGTVVAAMADVWLKNHKQEGDYIEKRLFVFGILSQIVVGIE